MKTHLERRQSPRKRFQDLLYVEIEPGNGGMLLNFSEHGFGFRAVRRVRLKQEVNFAFSIEEKRRVQGRGRIEWADEDGRVAGLQFTEISDEIRSQIRTWLAATPSDNSSPQTSTSSHGLASDASAMVAPLAEQSDTTRPSTASPRRREALAKLAAKPDDNQSLGDPVHPAESRNGNEATRNEDSAAIRSSSAANTQEAISSSASRPGLILPPAIGSDRPTVPMLRSETLEEQRSHAGSQGPVESPLSAAGDETEIGFESPFEREQASATVSAAVEARISEAMNQHARLLLQHFQDEQQRALDTFRESSSRVQREAERRLFPIRESVHAHISSLETAIASAASTAKVLDQYPALLEKAQQQALDRFQAQLHEVMRVNITELRRRTDAMMEEVSTQARAAAFMPKRISTSAGILVTFIIIAALALLFTFRRETAAGFIWLGQQMVEQQPAPENISGSHPSVATGKRTDTRPGTSGDTSTGPVTSEKPQPNGEAKADSSDGAPSSDHPASGTPNVVTPTETRPTQTDSIPPPQRSVRSLWDAVSKGDVEAEVTLGTMYMTGHGVSKSCYQAHRLMAAAARKGNDEARQKLAELDRAGCT